MYFQDNCNLILPRGTRYLKMESPILNYLMIILILFETNVDSGTQVKTGTPQMITRQKKEMSNIKYSARNFATTHGENPPGGGILHLTGSLFL